MDRFSSFHCVSVICESVLGHMLTENIPGFRGPRIEEEAVLLAVIPIAPPLLQVSPSFSAVLCGR